jgi:hypothetical protein
MDVHFPTLEEPSSPVYVLAVVRDMHRQASESELSG